MTTRELTAVAYFVLACVVGFLWHGVTSQHLAMLILFLTAIVVARGPK